MEELDHKAQCFFCNQPFNYGIHKYHGEWVPEFKLLICHSCQRANHDGLRHDWEAKFEKHLEYNNIPRPNKNIEGYYPVPKK